MQHAAYYYRVSPGADRGRICLLGVCYLLHGVYGPGVTRTVTPSGRYLCVAITGVEPDIKLTDFNVVTVVLLLGFVLGGGGPARVVAVISKRTLREQVIP